MFLAGDESSHAWLDQKMPMLSACKFTHFMAKPFLTTHGSNHESNRRPGIPPFSRASRYNPEWVLAGVSGGANPLWLTEWLTESLELKPGMRILDLGCGRALSSIFLRREFGVQVWATDLWFNAAENLQRVRDAGLDDGVFPIHADARSLPFAEGFFDAIISIDSFVYYGTDEHYLNYSGALFKA